MCWEREGEHINVIHIYVNKPIDYVTEYRVHKGLEDGRAVC